MNYHTSRAYIMRLRTIQIKIRYIQFLECDTPGRFTTLGY